MKKRKKLSGWKITSIVFGVFVFIVSLSMIITNLFVPVRYLSAYFVKADVNAAGNLRISFINVGYGDCTVVEFPDGKTALIDGGDGARSSEIKVLKALNARGIDVIDYLVCTSVAGKRCGGLTDIIKYKKVNNIFAPYCPVTYINDEFRNFSEIVSDKNLPVGYCEYGNGVIGAEGYTMCFFSPSVHTAEGGETDIFLSDPTSANIGNASAVVWIEYGGTGVLLTGDIDKSVSDKLCDKFELGFEMNGRVINASKCKIMTVPAGGAKNSVNERLYQTFTPETVILSVGANGLALPNVNAIADAQNYVGNGFYRTDNDGTITVTVDKSSYSVQKEK